MKESCRKFATVTLGLSIVLFILGLLLVILGPLTTQVTSYSEYVANYEMTTCIPVSSAVVTLQGQDGPQYVANWKLGNGYNTIISPTAGQPVLTFAALQLNDYIFQMTYDCYCRSDITSPVMMVDPLTSNIWPNCCFDVKAMKELKKIYYLHSIGLITWIVSFVVIGLFAITLIVGCIAKACSKRKDYDNLDKDRDGL